MQENVEIISPSDVIGVSSPLFRYFDTKNFGAKNQIFFVLFCTVFIVLLSFLNSSL